MAGTSILVLGGSGFVGSRVRERWVDDFELIAPPRAELDLFYPAALEPLLAATSAQLVLNLAAWADVDGAEAERDDQAAGS